jgi:hypothetical protein
MAGAIAPYQGMRTMTLIELVLILGGGVVLIGCALIGTPIYAFCRYMRGIERDEQVEAAEYMTEAPAADEWRRAA